MRAAGSPHTRQLRAPLRKRGACVFRGRTDAASHATECCGARLLRACLRRRGRRCTALRSHRRPGTLCQPSEGWQSGRMRRSRKPFRASGSDEGSNPSPSAETAKTSRLQGFPGHSRGRARPSALRSSPPETARRGRRLSRNCRAPVILRRAFSSGLSGCVRTICEMNPKGKPPVKAAPPRPPAPPLKPATPTHREYNEKPQA
jgi:hypothetical protein